MSNPLVSVVIPTYNRCNIIGETLSNIFQQTYPNIEVIVVDDGSTDNTDSVLASYGDRIRWTTQSNAGPAAARNRGICMAKGEIIAFQDSDDAWYPTKIARQVSLLERAGKEVTCCLCNMVVDFRGKSTLSFNTAYLYPSIEEGIWLNVTEVLATRFLMFNQAAAVRREVLTRIGGFDESYRLMEDGELALRLSLEGPWAFIRDALATRQDKLENTLSWSGTKLNAYEYDVRIREGTLARMNTSRHNSLRPVMQRELRRARRNLRAAQIHNCKALWSRVAGWSWEMWEHYRMAAERRMPGFPKMSVTAVDIA